MAGPLFCTTVVMAEQDAAERFAEALDLSPLPIEATAVTLPAKPGNTTSVDIYSLTPLEQTAVEAILDLGLGPDVPVVEIVSGPVGERDWVAASQAGLPPIDAGRFFVHGSHDRHRRPASGHAIEIEAGEAFGTGHHATTKGCLLAFERILRKDPPCRVLDLGTGSGILAIAAASTLHRPVTASDIDPIATRVAIANARLNRVAPWFRGCTAAGTHHPMIRLGRPYDLVFANILARPLIALAPQIRAILAIGGRAILSGLTVDQEAPVIGAYLAQGLVSEERSRLEGWSTLTVRRSVSERRASPRRLRECHHG